ncbi:hypothetical protein [Candidatus Tisiphia endosymbiont of Parasteatoda lunata]|uniref:hypothetical protein n=1 Tax=Candidatus Tisiphia endosymbiont of Parasteatoda lunata TaxID=3066275 RepID=UPI00313D0CBE
MIRYLKFMLKRRTASAGFFSQSGTINDFRGKSYAVPEDYLVAIGKDKQVMQYINPQSVIGKEIKNELQNAAETQKNQGIIVKATI